MSNGPDRFQLRGDHITLGQLLKAADIVGSGGEVKAFLAKGGIKVNGEGDNRRGRKLRAGDRVELPLGMTLIIEESKPDE